MLKAEYIQKIRKDKILKAKIMLRLGKSEDTIYRWLNIRSESLLNIEVIKLICDHYGVSQSEILEPRERIVL